MVRPDPRSGLGARGTGYPAGMARGTEAVDVEAARREVATGDALAVDVRSEEEWGEGHVPGALHLPDADLEKAAQRPDDGARLMVIAENGKMAARAAEQLGDEGYDAVAVDGDMGDWVSEGFNVQPTEDPDPETELGAG
jgi:phage shock protein E